MNTAWEPILHGAEADRAQDIVRKIALALRELSPHEQLGLEGAAGQALFLAYAESAGIEESLGASAALEAAVTALSAGSTPIGLWNGCVGVRWMLDHLAAGDEAGAAIARIDEAVLAALGARSWTGMRDLYSGLAGILLAYAGDSSDTGARILSSALDHLEVLGWDGGSRETGVAHGAAGVIAALARCTRSSDVAERARRCIPGLVAWLGSSREVGAAARPRWGGARLGWCHGDSGIALGLLAAARALGSERLERDASATALGMESSPGEDGPLDACLCHGTAGMGHLANRMYQATGHAIFADRARQWLRRTMDMAQPGEGIGGYVMMRRKHSRAWWGGDPTLLVGSAGVGLALLAAATEQPPCWDSVLAADVEAPALGGKIKSHRMLQHRDAVEVSSCLV